MELRLVDPKDNTNWQTQYTGFDPSLELPREVTDSFAEEFLRAFAASPEAQAQIRTIVRLAIPGGKVQQITHMGGLIEGKDTVVSFDPSV